MEKELIITIGEYNRFYGKVCITKNFLKTCDLNVGDKAKITKVSEGKFLVEKSIVVDN